MKSHGHVEHNGASIHYSSVGEGPDIIFIHGFAANHAFWHIKILFSLARRYRITTYDLRGHGLSSMPKKGYSSADMAHDLHALINHLDIEKAHLVGHSFGGVVGLHYAALHGDRVAGLTLADSRVRTFQPTQRPKDWPNWPAAKETLAKMGIEMPPDEPEAGLWLLEKLAQPEWREKRDQLMGSQLFIPFCQKRSGKKTAEKWLKLLSTTTARSDLVSSGGLTSKMIASIKCPVMAIYGELTKLKTSYSELMKCLPRCKGKIVPGRGHFFPLTEPDLFIENLDTFFIENNWISDPDMSSL